MGVKFFRHDLGQPELDAIAAVFSGTILTTGDFVAEFEQRFARRLGRRHAIAVTSCTGALHMSLMACGIGAGDEVITTPMTFIATATAIVEAGATPVFVDIEADTGNMDAEKIEAAITPRTKAIIPVHLYGQMVDMRRIKAIADRHGLRVIEDAAHCIEGQRDGVTPGELAATACFSFYATKNITCGEGGAVVTDDDALAAKLRLLRLHGMTKNAADRDREGYQHWDMTTLGWKYNLDNIHAAMMLPQLDRLDLKWENRRAVAARYDDQLSGIRGVSRPAERPHVRHAHHLYVVRVDPGVRDAVILHLHENGIGSMVNYRSIHLLTYFRTLLHHRIGDFPHAEQFGDSVISLPFYPGMPSTDVDLVVAEIKAAVGLMHANSSS
jgi:dTDP-4-amino-4,6-dideoxygalactose transaminase